MVILDVDPQATISAPRPMPDEVLILTCDADGGRAWVAMSKAVFAELADPSLLSVLENSTERLCASPGKRPGPEWALKPETLDAREAAKDEYLADPDNIRRGSAST
jgi:hypothetical protein